MGAPLMVIFRGTAVEDGMIRHNPCRIKGAGQERSPERPVLTLRQVFDLASAFAARYRLLVLLSVFCSLRWGELAALRRRHIDVAAGLIRIEVAVVELADGSPVTGTPKSQAGIRWANIPAFLISEVVQHLAAFTGPGADSLIFTSPKGGPLRRSNFSGPWARATQAVGLTGIHFHDLRHTGNMLASEAGATLRELMDRMGHSSTRAA